MNDAELKDLYELALNNQVKDDLVPAIEQLTQLLLEKPDIPGAWNNRAAILQKLGHPFDAVMNYDRAIALAPDMAEAYNNRGTAFGDLELFEKAIVDYDCAIAKHSQFAVPYTNRGNALMRLGKIQEAADSYRKSIEQDAEYFGGHFGLSIALLKLGQYEEGWDKYEWRWKSNQLPLRGLYYPNWEGERAKSKDDVLLLYGEQGIGDIIQFMRYASVAKTVWRGKVFIEVRHPVTRLAKTLRGIDGVITVGEKPPARTTAIAAMMSLPRILWPQQGGVIPSRVPYLSTDDYLSDVWRARLKAFKSSGLLVGLCWAGMSREHSPELVAIDKRRSMSLSDFTPMGTVPGICWVSLQLGPPSEQVKTPPAGMTIGDWTGDLADFHDTAALVECLDLVITVDTAVAHLAGALGKPVWMASRFDGCWRWLLNREDTPWYPTMKIYNQSKPNEWADVVERMTTDLRGMTSIVGKASVAA